MPAIMIDPMVDCVFKALLGSEENRNLLIHFLNAVIRPPLWAQIVSVDLLNPFNERAFQEGKQTIVDVRARDAQGSFYQIEIQRRRTSHLPERIGYTWATGVGLQLKKGQAYKHVRPTVAIWIMGERLYPDNAHTCHRLRLCDPETGANIEEVGGIHILELTRPVEGSPPPKSERERWLRFFAEAKDVDLENLPDYLKTPEMGQAMDTLKTFSERERRAHLYERRLIAERIELDYQSDLKEAKEEAEAYRAEAEANRAEALASAEREQAAREEARAAAEREQAAQEEIRRLRERLQAVEESGDR